MEEETIRPIERLLLTTAGKFAELLEQSEKRINSTNDMICNLSEASLKQREMLLKLTDEYSKHIGNLIANRDEIANQNTKLIEIVARSQEMCRYSDERYDKLLACMDNMMENITERIINKVQAGRNVSESNINLGK